MRTEDLIVALAADARPVRLLEPALVRFVRWSAAAVTSAAAVVWVVGVRADLAESFAAGASAGTFAIVVAAGVLAAAATQLSAVPGAAGARATRAGALAALATWGLLLLAQLLGTPAPMAALFSEPAYPACAWLIAAVALVPGATACWQLRRAAALQPGWSAALAAAASLATGAAATQLICPLDHAAHTITWHLLPVAALAAAAGVIARSFQWSAGSPRSAMHWH